MSNTESVPYLLRRMVGGLAQATGNDVVLTMAADMIETSMCWIPARIEDIDVHADYVVKTNDGEWNDPDLFVMRGFVVHHKLNRDYIRGRPLCVAKITNPPKSCLPQKNYTAT